jgi:hypothetical protein
MKIPVNMRMSVRQQTIALLGPSLYCLLIMATVTTPASVFAQAARPAPLSASSCPSGSTFTAAFKAAQAYTGAVHVARLVKPSLHQAEASLFQAAEGLMNAPQLFAIDVNFNDFLHRGPNNSALDMIAYYATPCDQVEYLGLDRSMTGNGNMASLGKEAFVNPYSCSGGALLAPQPMTFPPSAPEPESNHPPVRGWTVDLPQLWSIAKSHEALFAMGVERCEITTAARLKKDDSSQPCHEPRSFKPSNGAAKRLANEQGQRAVIELVEYGLQQGQCQEGHYLIVDAHTGVDLESGTFDRCFFPPV